MAASGKSTLRLVLYGVAAIYLVSDLFVFKGPLRQKVDLANPASPAAVEASKARGVIARVSGHPITRSQVDRAVSEQLWLDGQSEANLSPDEIKAARIAALDEIIDHDLLRLQVKALAPQLAVTSEEIDERLKRLVGRFENKGALETAMKSQGIETEKDLKARIEARIQQEKFIALRIAPAIRVSDEEARAWFDTNATFISYPERIEARHVFIPTLDVPPEKAKQKLDEALLALDEKKKDFQTLAKEISMDPATKETGGNLGWMTRDRLPADFAAPVMTMEMNKPQLVRTKIGWHLVEVTGRKPVEPRTFEHAKHEIIAALEATKRQQAVSDFRASLRKIASVKIEILQPY